MFVILPRVRQPPRTPFERMEKQVYRLTIKIGKPGRMYEVQDIDAPDLLAALRAAVEVFPEDAKAAELLELRRLSDPDRREYTPA